MDCYKLNFSTYTQLQNFISHHNESLQLRQHNINKFVVLPNNIIKRGQTYYKFSNTEHPEELNGISQQKGKLSKLTDKPKNLVNTYKLYLEDQTRYYIKNSSVMIDISLLYIVSSIAKLTELQEQLNKQKSQNKVTLLPDVIEIYAFSKSITELDKFIKSDEAKDIFIQSFARKLNIPYAKQFNQLISKVVGLDKKILSRLNLSDFKGTIKIDGLRTLLVIDENTKAQYLIQQKNQQSFNTETAQITVLDCEAYDNKYYVFDALFIENTDVMNLSYQQRLDKLAKYNLPKNCVMKKFIELHKYTDLCVAFDDYADGIKIDGFIINNMEKTYTCTEAYKLKAKKYLTNDYLVKRVVQPSNEISQLTNLQEGETLYELYCGSSVSNFRYVNTQAINNGKKYQPMLFAVPYFNRLPTQYMKVSQNTIKTIKKYYGTDEVKNMQQFIKNLPTDIIVECAFDDDMCPYPIRIREDKTYAYKQGQTIYGNDFTTALQNLENAMDPITPEFLANPINSAYFQISQPSQEYNNFRQFGLSARRHCFNNTLSLIKKVSESDKNCVSSGCHSISFLDIGAGRGVNYHLAVANDFNAVIAYEPDVQANFVYYQRLRDSMKHTSYKILPKTYIVNHYISDDIKYQLQQHSINFFNADYSFHYLCTSESSVKELKQFILLFAKKNAYFNVLYYDGNAILDLLKSQQTNIQDDQIVYDNGRYHIKLLSTLADAEKQKIGTKIEIMLPTIDPEPKTEPLVFMSKIQQIFEPEIKLYSRQCLYDEITEKQVDEKDKDYFRLIYNVIFKISL